MKTPAAGSTHVRMSLRACALDERLKNLLQLAPVLRPCCSARRWCNSLRGILKWMTMLGGSCSKGWERCWRTKIVEHHQLRPSFVALRHWGRAAV